MKLPLLSLLLAQPSRGAFQQRVEPPHSSSRRRAALTRLSDASWFDRLGSFLSPAEDEVAPWEASAEARDAVRLLCREGGWKLRCTLGTAAAKSVGGSGELANRRAPAADIDADFVISFSIDEGFDPPQGAVELVRRSRLLAADEGPSGRRDAAGFWKTTVDDELTMVPTLPLPLPLPPPYPPTLPLPPNPPTLPLPRKVPTQVQLRLRSLGISSAGESVVPPGAVYLNAKVAYDPVRAAAPTPNAEGLTLYDGRVTVKEDVGGFGGFSGGPIFSAKGILAEFKIVGTFEASPAEASPPDY